MTALSKIKSAGFSVTLVDGFIEISPGNKLTDTQREYLKTNKAEIILELQAEALTYPRIVTCWTPDGNPMAVLAKDAEHEAFLLKMNPKPKDKTC